ncbi:DUF2071 domain-containing protein [Enemella evansiae]|uniref:DUF2071 domain-containing protein n=1 Tax=Enemella evansiae TaxID=2016499 RepID=UPI0015C5C09B|nr:DUF2071 domain-containing protein [Enemella evansiae]
MRIPRLRGEIERRLLVNYRVTPEAIAPLLPAPFRPQLHNGYAVAGICLIRLGSLRPAGLPAVFGMRSENAAHRIAVEWDEAGEPRAGVWIPRRDSDSRLTVALGGRAFPGEHHHAHFEVHESDRRLRVAFAADDGTARVSVDVAVDEELPESLLFASLAEASAFFEQGAVGWSATRDPVRHDGLRLRTTGWRVEPVQVRTVHSTFFEDPARFPPGTAMLDNALLMRRVPVDWESLTSLSATAPRG